MADVNSNLLSPVFNENSHILEIDYAIAFDLFNLPSKHAS
jgi:hypothetical protein